MKPVVLGLLFGLFLSLPGLLLKIASVAVAFYSAMSLAAGPDLQGDLHFIANIMLAGFAFALGSVMGSLADTLETSNRPWKTGPPRIALIHVGLKTLALLGGCAAVAVVAYFARGMWVPALAACGSGALLLVAGLALQNSGAALFSKNEPDIP